MIFIYRLLFFPIFVVLLLKNLPKMWRRGGYRKHLAHRFGFLPQKPKEDKPRIWAQAVSVGEINAIKNLIKILSRDFEIVLTTTTTTAEKIIRNQLMPYVSIMGYFPWDFWLFSHIAWKRIQPDAIILVESELWPEHIYQAKLRDVPVILVNARLSDRSFNRYCYIKNLAMRFWNELDLIVASSNENRQKIASFYSRPIECYGNLKFDFGDNNLSLSEIKSLKQELGFNENSLVLLGCSTWPGEEVMLLEVLKQLKNFNRDWRLLIVPRHAERREKIIQQIQQFGFTYHQRSTGESSKPVEVCLADTTGELSKLTQVVDLAFVGKSLFPNNGGQSPLDVAHAGVATVYGDRMTNFRDICQQIESIHGAIKVHSADEAKTTLIRLAQQDVERKNLAKAIKSWFDLNQGASEKTAKLIREFL